MSDTAYGANVRGTVTAGSKVEGVVTAGPMIVNDWVIDMEQTADGGVITARRGSEVQTLELKNGTGGGGGGVYFETDETLSLVDGVLGVNTAAEPDPDNTLPITSAAVYTTVGNINALLETI